MSWFLDTVPKYEPNYFPTELPVIQYGLLEDLPDEQYELEVEGSLTTQDLVTSRVEHIDGRTSSVIDGPS